MMAEKRMNRESIHHHSTYCGGVTGTLGFLILTTNGLSHMSQVPNRCSCHKSCAFNGDPHTLQLAFEFSTPSLSLPLRFTLFHFVLCSSFDSLFPPFLCV